jgi:hypothetical protein
MQKISDITSNDSILFFGRTIIDNETGGVFFNWSGSGFEVVFEGKRLDAYLSAIETVFPPEGTLWPWISVFFDDNETPVKEIAVDRHEHRVTLFSSEVSERHKIRVVKRSENDKGKVGILGFESDGSFLSPEPVKSRYRLEFIGDSITCGFGNEANRRDDMFKTEEENGLSAFSAIAAREIGAEYNSICVSGIPLCKPSDPQFKLVSPDSPENESRSFAMEDYYEYTDRLHEEKRGIKSSFTKWDFSGFLPDAIIINLGTNDSFLIKASKNKEVEERNFETRYKEFLYRVRKLNGQRPIISCTLGPIDYYLYDNILNAVKEYKQETGDMRIFCHKFGGIFPDFEGYGAQGHPSVLTHKRMGKELGEKLKEWLGSEHVNGM